MTDLQTSAVPKGNVLAENMGLIALVLAGVAGATAYLVPAFAIPAKLVFFTALILLAWQPLRGRVRLFFRSPLAVVGSIGLMICIFLALFAAEVSPQNPYDLAVIDVMDNQLPPGGKSFDERFTYHLGTDQQGRDILSAIIYGLRISLLVAVISTGIAMLIGIFVGIYAAYAGGRTETIIMRLVDLQLSFPSILIALMLMATFGRGIDKVIIALIVVQWAYYARTVRGAALSEYRKEYVEAAQVLGLPRWRIITSHLLPNCIPPIIVISTVQVANTIVLEASLSFLGVGTKPTEPSLGLLIANGYSWLLSGKYWMSTFPGVALVLLVFCINLVGDRLRDVLNPRLRR